MAEGTGLENRHTRKGIESSNLSLSADMTQPIPYEARFRVGTRVRIGELAELARFQADWKQHHPLQPEQLEYAGQIATVGEIAYYQGGDVLYTLENVPGIWHEPCLAAA